MADLERDPEGTGAKLTSAAIVLSEVTRFYCALVGLAGGVFAGVILWRGTDGAATVAFVALGALFLLLAVTGVVPRRIKSGGTEVELTRDQVDEAVKQSTDAALDTMSRPEIENFIADTLRNSAADPTGVKYAAASRAQEAADFEGEVVHVLMNHFKITQRPGFGSSPYDLLAETPLYRIAFDIRLTFRIDMANRILASPDGAYDIYCVIVSELPRNPRNRLALFNRLQERLSESGRKVIVAEWDKENIGWLVQRLSDPAGAGRNPIPDTVFANFNM